MKKAIKKNLKKTICAASALALLTSTAQIMASANTENEPQTVHVVIENTKFSVDEGAKWDGVLVDEYVALENNSTMLTVITDALSDNGYTQTGAESGYITEINGVSAYDGGFMSGWVMTLNDWFTNEGAASYNVKDGTLSGKDEIRLMYSLDYGADCGSYWDNNDNSLSFVAFSEGKLDREFSSSERDYTLTISGGCEELSVSAAAANKNYQVRVYKNEYTPDVNGTEYKNGKNIPVSDGDKIIIGAGDPVWPSMNFSSEAAVYTFTVSFADGIFGLGDADRNGVLDIRDVTVIQKYIASASELDEEQLSLADYNCDGSISITDITAIQKSLAGIS